MDWVVQIVIATPDRRGRPSRSVTTVRRVRKIVLTDVEKTLGTITEV